MSRLATTAFMNIIFYILVLSSQVRCSRMKYAKIIGGGYAAYGEFPYQLSLENYYREANLFLPFCGASAISDTWALSAAHCMFEEGQKVLPEDIILRSGSLMKGENGTLHSVDKFIIHHIYSEDAPTVSILDADISLIKVKDLFSINPYVNYVRLPYQWQRIKAGTLTTAVGWGMIDPELSETSTMLKKTVLVVLDRKKCENTPHFRWGASISKRMMCAAASNTDTAPGDSGGPLVTTGGSRHTQVGIVSWGSGTGQMDDPGIYTKVSAFRVWISVKSGV